MIRINLIGAERRAGKSRTPSLNLGQRVTIAGSLLLVLSAVGLGWRYWSLTQSEARVASDIVAAHREESRLSEVIKQVSEFETQRTQLQQRVALIDELRRGQTAPVHIIDQISRALPEMTWLTTLKQAGYEVTLEGRCMSLTALSDFVANLEATRYFKRPVEIISSEVVSTTRGGPELIEFTIKGTFHMTGIDQPAPESRGRKKGPGKGGQVG
ncbi:MAG: PilN domain-containing protein [Acidobacteriota bacterium]